MFDQLQLEVLNFKDWIKSGFDHSYFEFTQNRIDAFHTIDEQLVKEMNILFNQLGSIEETLDKIKNVPKDQIDGYILNTRKVSHLNPDPLLLKTCLVEANKRSKHIKIRYVESTQNLEIYIKR